MLLKKLINRMFCCKQIENKITSKRIWEVFGGNFRSVED